MMKHEFEALAGYEVSSKDYDEIIEPMYMATNLSKQEFVKVIDAKRFALKTEKQIVSEMKKIAKQYAKAIQEMADYDEICEIKDKLHTLRDELVERFYSSFKTYLDYDHVEHTVKMYFEYNGRWADNMTMTLAK